MPCPRSPYLRAPDRRRAWQVVAIVVVLALVLVLPTGPLGPGFASPAPPAAPRSAASDLSHSTPSAGPPGAQGGLSVSIFNPGANATGVYDQPLGINSSQYSGLINSNWTNAIVEYTTNGTPVFGWIEGGATNHSVDTRLWLRMDSIPGRSWANVTIWFEPTASFNLSANGYLGEAPQLSVPYGAFDNGAKVFDEYWNFSGTALPPGWTPLGGWSGTVDRGLRVATSYHMGAIEFPFASPYSAQVTVEADAQLNSSGDPVALFVAATPGFSATNGFFPDAYALEPGLGGTAHAGLLSSDPNGVSTRNVGLARAPVDFRQSPIVVGLSWSAANASEVGSAQYLPFVSQTNSSNAPIAAMGLGSACELNCSTWNVTWVRARTVPTPMPVVSGGAFSPVGVAVTAQTLVTDANHAVLFGCNASVALTPPTFYQWRFGDGQTAVGAAPAHAFGLPGTYFPACTASDAAGLAGTSSLTLVIHPNLAILLFQAVPSTFPLGSSLNLVLNMSGGTAPFTITYSGLPPGCPLSHAATVTCLPGVTGTFGVEVSVSDSVGEQASNSITITVTPPVPPSQPPSLSPSEGYALAGGVAGLVVLAGVLPVLLWDRRIEQRRLRSAAERIRALREREGVAEQHRVPAPAGSDDLGTDPPRGSD